MSNFAGYYKTPFIMIKKTTFSLIFLFTISLSGFAQTWDGSTSSDWGTASNWDTNSVPGSGDVVIIGTNGNSPAVNGLVSSVLRVHIIEDGKLTIAFGGSLTVTSEIEIIDTGKLVIENSGNLTVEKTLQARAPGTSITNKGELIVGSNPGGGIIGILNVYGTFTQDGGNTQVGRVLGVFETGKFNLNVGKVTIYRAETFDLGVIYYSFYAKLGSVVNIESGTTIECFNDSGVSLFANISTITNKGTISLSSNITLMNLGGGFLNNKNGSHITATNIENDGTIDMDGATLTVTNSMSNGSKIDAEYNSGDYSSSPYAVLKMYNSSTLSAKNFVNYHNSTVDSDDLTFTVTKSLSNDGVYDMDGGIITIGELFSGGYNGVFNLNSGDIEVTGFDSSNNLSFWYGTQVSIANILPPTTLNILEGGNLKFLSAAGIVYNQATFNLKGKMDVAGELWNVEDDPNSKTNGVFTVKSDASGTGSLITGGDVTNTGTMTVERWIDPDKTWQLVSTPMMSQTSNVFYGHYLNYYDMPNGSFNHIKQTTYPLGVASGLVSKRDDKLLGYAPNPIIFTGGVINHVRLPKSLEVGEGNTYFGLDARFNFTGNPYTSNLDWDLVYNDLSNTGENKDNITATYYYYEDDGSKEGATTGWKPYNANTGTGAKRYISIGQGFGVILKGTPVANKINFERAYQTHDGGNAFGKKSSSFNNYFELNTNSNDLAGKIYFRNNSSATNNFDEDFDAYQLNSFGDSPTSYFVSDDGKRLAICEMPESESVDLGFNMAVSGEVTFSLSNAQDFTEIVLEDKETGDFVDLLISDYTFTYSDDEAETGRFTLHFKKGALSEIEKLDNLSIYSNSSTLYLKSDSRLNNVNVSIYSVTGQEVMSKHYNTLTNIEINTELKGVYILKLSSEKGNHTTKLILN